MYIFLVLKKQNHPKNFKLKRENHDERIKIGFICSSNDTAEK